MTVRVVQDPAARVAPIVNSLPAFRDEPPPGVDWMHRPSVHEALLAAIVESSDDAIVSKTLDGVVTSWNDGARRLFGWTAAEMIGASIRRIIPPELHAEEDEILARLRAGERIRHYETERLARDGTRLAISLTVSPVRDADGRIVGASKVARDVTERRRMEAALRDADRRKDEFLAVLSHELRNPLAPVRSAARLLTSPAVTPDQVRWCAEVIARQSAQLGALLDDLLNVARVTQGTLRLQRRRVPLSGVVETAIESVADLMTERRHRFERRLPRLDPELDVDPVRLTQVIANLLVNAARYTPPGGHVLLEAEAAGRDLVLRVHDDGAGLDPEFLPRAFELFTRGPQRPDTAVGGLGVGLALVRRLVELHDGTVVAVSDGAGLGSTFEVRLPVVAGVAER